jgi:hypothetical protein
VQLPSAVTDCMVFARSLADEAVDNSYPAIPKHSNIDCLTQLLASFSNCRD